ncbi:MAG: hypothetical protein HFE64_00955 [Lachnospiraceae bacterium]|jgi:ABC-type glycerol-3-phosphate transport system substrate-binding protein|nr:hypothetical protein [Lachnospiraceae bacterium]
MKKIFALLLCAALVCCAFGCTRTEEPKPSSSAVSGEAAPLRVYYVGEADTEPMIRALLDWYKTSDDCLPIEATSFKSAEELEQALEGDKAPDVILLDKYSSSFIINPFQWAKDGKLAGLHEYLQADTDYDPANYINGAIEAGKCGDEQFILPLSVSIQYLITDAQTLGAGGLSELSDQYTAQQLLQALMADADLHKDSADYCSQLPLMLSISNRYQWMYEVLEHTGALHVDREAGQVAVDPALFALTMEYFRTTMDMAFPYFSGAATVTSMSFADIRDFCTVILGNSNMICAARYMSSACHQLLQQDAELLFYPLGDGDGYSVNINIMGMVSASSSQPEAAVRFLRALMDIPHDQWEMITMYDAMAMLTPVNQNEALALIDSFRSLSGGQYQIQKQAFDREALPQDLADSLQSLIQENKQAFIVDADICTVLEAYLADYLSGQTNSLPDDIAEKVQKAIEDSL